MNRKMGNMEWQIIETAPKDGSFIDAYDCNDGDRKIVQWGKDHQYYIMGWVYDKDYGDYGSGATLWDAKPTHWLLLPQPKPNR